MAIDADVVTLKTRLNALLRLAGALQETVDFYRTKHGALPDSDISTPRDQLITAINTADDRLSRILQIVATELDTDTSGLL